MKSSHENLQTGELTAVFVAIVLGYDTRVKKGLLKTPKNILFNVNIYLFTINIYLL